MSVKKLHTNYNTIYYITFTCIRWVNLFEITNIYEFVYRWFEILVKYKVYNCAYVIMPNHLHILAYTKNPEKTIDKLTGNGKRFEIIERLEKTWKKRLTKTNVRFS
ncbi:MAG: hypothetical protein IPG78_10850 [Ignavibacteria bacterium]|nr:hypothetical protein [Ignavibacteria bacterium]